MSSTTVTIPGYLPGTWQTGGVMAGDRVSIQLEIPAVLQQD